MTTYIYRSLRLNTLNFHSKDKINTIFSGNANNELNAGSFQFNANYSGTNANVNVSSQEGAVFAFNNPQCVSNLKVKAQGMHL